MSKPPPPVLTIAFDGSPSARAALVCAAALFPGSPTTVLSVASDLGASAATARMGRAALPEDVIRAAVASWREDAMHGAGETAEAGRAQADALGLDARAEVVAGEGSTWSAILDTAHAAGSDVVVCGTRGHGAALRAVLGSVATTLVHRSDLPVLLVPGEAQPTDGPVLIGFDSSPSAETAVLTAGRLLAGRTAVVVHRWRSEIRHTVAGFALAHAPVGDVRELTSALDDLFEEPATEIGERGAALATAQGLVARALVVEARGPVAATLLQIADEVDAAVVVVGRKGQSALADVALGSVSASLVHAADRPLLVSGS